MSHSFKTSEKGLNPTKLRDALLHSRKEPPPPFPDDLRQYLDDTILKKWTYEENVRYNFVRPNTNNIKLFVPGHDEVGGGYNIIIEPPIKKGTLCRVVWRYFFDTKISRMLYEVCINHEMLDNIFTHAVTRIKHWKANVVPMLKHLGFKYNEDDLIYELQLSDSVRVQALASLSPLCSHCMLLRISKISGEQFSDYVAQTPEMFYDMLQVLHQNPYAGPYDST